MATITIDKNNFEEEVVNSTKPVLLDFWASWCGRAAWFLRLWMKSHRNTRRSKWVKSTWMSSRNLQQPFR